MTCDYIADEVNDVAIICTTDSLPITYRDGADKLWKQIGYNRSKEDANDLYRQLFRREFMNNKKLPGIHSFRTKIVQGILSNVDDFRID